MQKKREAKMGDETWSINDVTYRYHKVRPPFIWQIGNTHLSFAQVKESMKHACVVKNICRDSEWPLLVKELDRRYFLSEKLRWEFAARDPFGDGLIPLCAAKEIAVQVHGRKKRFPTKEWKAFVEGRTLPNADVAYDEIEVFLCNIYDEGANSVEGDGEKLDKETKYRVLVHSGSYDLEDDFEDDLKCIDQKLAIFEQMEKRRVEDRKASLQREFEMAEKVKDLESERRKREEAEERTRLEVEEMARLEAEEKVRLEEEEKVRLEAEEKASLEAEEKARLEAEKKARLEAEEKTRLEAEEKARVEAEEKTRLEAEKKARLVAEEKAMLEAEEKVRLEAEEKVRLEEEEKTRIITEEKARRKAEKKEKLRAEKKARLQAEDKEKARLEAEVKVMAENEEKARLEYEEKARLEAEEKARLEGEEKARLEAEEKARLEAEEKARLEAEEKARLEAEEKARLEAEEKARLEAEEKARLEAEKMTPKQKEEQVVRQKLKASLIKKEKKDLEIAIGDFKKNKLDDVDGDLQKAERLVKTINAKVELGQAVDKRLLAELERLMEVVKTEKMTGDEIGEDLLARAKDLFVQLKKLERAQKDILDLKQSTIAEIRGYSNPPPPVHQIMMATLLLIGHKEKELKNWQTVQATLGKTGKEGIKRRIIACKPEYVVTEAAVRARELLRGFDLVEIKDVSLGAGTFFVWATNMIDSCLS